MTINAEYFGFVMHMFIVCLVKKSNVNIFKTVNN